MKVRTISATYGRKVNLGDFNSSHVEMTLWADLEDGDNEASCANALRDMARNHVMNEVARVTGDAKLSAKVEQLIMGLPVEVRSDMPELSGATGD